MAIEVDEDAFDFGARLQKTRNLSGLTQEQLAKKLGISKQTISSYECEKAIHPDCEETRAGLKLLLGLSLRSGK